MTTNDKPTKAQAFCLRAMAASGIPLSVLYLCRNFAMRADTVSVCMRAGWLERVASTDRTSVYVQITDAGLNAIGK